MQALEERAKQRTARRGITPPIKRVEKTPYAVTLREDGEGRLLQPSAVLQRWSLMSEAIEIRELKSHASEIVRRVREDGTSFDVTYRGRTVARLVPVRETASSVTVDEFLNQLDRTAAEISQRWPTGVSAVDAVRNVRRDL